jgi:hypothetical protein
MELIVEDHGEKQRGISIMVIWVSDVVGKSPVEAVSFIILFEVNCADDTLQWN